MRIVIPIFESGADLHIAADDARPLVHASAAKPAAIAAGDGSNPWPSSLPISSTWSFDGVVEQIEHVHADGHAHALPANRRSHAIRCSWQWPGIRARTTL